MRDVGTGAAVNALSLICGSILASMIAMLLAAYVLGMLA